MSDSPATTESKTEGKKTPLYENHKAAGAKFTEFGCWLMPVTYSGLVDEHHSVRNGAGLFDVSHMGEITVRGPEAAAFLQYITSNDISKLTVGAAQYSLLLNPDGGVVDDIIVYKFADDDYFLCVNASNTPKDFAWLTKHNRFNCKVTDESADYSQVALQGPRSREILAKLLKVDAKSIAVEQFPAFTFRRTTISLPSQGETKVIVACTGYTGEDGFEIFAPAAAGPSLWETLLELGRDVPLKPAGLGARDTLRLEVCYPLHGHELSDTVSALSSGVGWVIKFNKGDFVGKEPLEREKATGVKRRLVGLEVTDRGIIREGAKLFTADGQSEIGWVTSGTKPPTVDRAVALGFVPENLSALDTELKAEVRGKLLAVKVIAKPFYKRAGASR